MGAIHRVAVVGGGLAGLSCARALSERNVDVVVFDKGRAPGGRGATRRVPPFSFDLGAQYFTVRSSRFSRLVSAWRAAGVCAPWAGSIVATSAEGGVRATEPVERFVGTPGMSALSRDLARGLVVQTSTRVDRIERRGDGHRLLGTTGRAGETLSGAIAARSEARELGVFDAVVVTLPPHQAHALLEDASSSLAQIVVAVSMDPCLALRVAVGESTELARVPFDGLFVGRDGEHALAWIARDSSKPDRPRAEAWVAHASAAWSRAHFDDGPEDVKRVILSELAKTLGVRAINPIATTYQRWAFARANAPLDVRACIDNEARLAVGGDWAAGGRLEGAVESGWALADRVLGLADPR